MTHRVLPQPAVPRREEGSFATEASFYVTGGTMRRDAPSYVERKADRELLEALLRGEFCYVLTSRQMGKSSLMVRTADKLRGRAVHVVVLDLSGIGQNLTPEQWYDGLIARIGRQLRLEDPLEAFWSGHQRISPVQRFCVALRDVVLPQVAGPLVIFVDEIDVVRSLPFSMDEFFAAIRECYNRRAEDPEFGRITFCLLGVATPSDLIRDTRITPFNIGQRIELNDFTAEEALPLANGLQMARHGRHSTAQRLLRRVLHWTNGHPYLTQRLCQALAQEETKTRAGRRDILGNVDRLCRDLFLSSRACEKDDNLIFVRERLLRSEVDRTSLLNQYDRVLRRKPVADDETNPLVSVLRLSGVVRAVNGRLIERNRIYYRVFDRKWVQANLPDADLRRQHEAFRHGVIRTTAIAAVIVGVMSIMVGIAVDQARKANWARASASFMEAQARRVSGLSGQRYESLHALATARRLGYPDEGRLRDEAIACLALVDLREATDGLHLPSTGRPMAICLNQEVSATAATNGALTLRSLRDGTIRARVPELGGVVEQLWLTQKTPLLICQIRSDSNRRVVIWNWQEGREVSVIKGSVRARAAIDFSRDETMLALGDNSRGGDGEGRITVYDLASGATLGSLNPVLSSGLPKTAAAIRFDPSDNLLALSSPDDHIVELWNVNARRRVTSFFHRDVVNDLAWNAQGSVLATACSDGSIYLWNTNDARTPAKILKGHESEVISLTFNRRGDLIASLGNDETIRLWNTATDEQLITNDQLIHRVPRAGLDTICFGVDDRFLVGRNNAQNAVRVWEVLGGESFILRGRGSRYFAGLDFSPDSQLLAGSTTDSVTIWDLHTGFERAVLAFTTYKSPYISSACFGARNDRLLVSTDGGLLQCALRREQTSEGLLIQPGPASRLTAITEELGRLTLNPDRSKAAVVWRTNVMAFRCDELMSQTNICIGERFTMLEIHPSGEWIAGRTLLSSGVQVIGVGANQGARVDLPSGPGDHFAFSPDGNWLAISSGQGFKFYQVGAWANPAFELPTSSDSDQNGPLAFTADGRTVAVVHSKYNIRLRRLGAQWGESKVVATLESPDRKPLLALAFSPDSRYLAVAMQDQSIRVWNLAGIRQHLAALDLDGGWSEAP
ncbi:MAG: AAA-like domain-containing protein [Verrucomicrobia subdivision 3 bacterium]|nr:AAA-like domain-containing protein [Limisphaerales bacterium]